MQEMNLEYINTIEILPGLINAGENEANDLQDQEAIFNAAKDFIPIIKAEELKVAASKKQLAMARGSLYPSLSLYAGYRTGYFETNMNTVTGEVIPFNDQITDNASRFVGVSLNIPISNGWSGRSRIKQQKVAMMRADNALAVQKQQMYQLIQQLVQEANALQSEYKQSSQRTEAQVLSFNIAQKRYEKGLISIIELNQSKNLLANARNENLQVQLRLMTNKSTLDFYKGLPVFNINSAQ